MSAPYADLLNDLSSLQKECNRLSTMTDCICKGKPSSSSWFTQSVNDTETHWGPGCVDRVIEGDGDNCLLAAICQNKFPTIPMPPCNNANACLYPLWVGEGSGLEKLQNLRIPLKDIKHPCDDWGCVEEKESIATRWNKGNTSTEEYVKKWKEYCATI